LKHPLNYLFFLLSRRNSLIKKKAAFKIESFTVTVTSGEQINQLLAAKRKKDLLVLVLAPWMKSVFFLCLGRRIKIRTAPHPYLNALYHNIKGTGTSYETSAPVLAAPRKALNPL